MLSKLFIWTQQNAVVCSNKKGSSAAVKSSFANFRSLFREGTREQTWCECRKWELLPSAWCCLFSLTHYLPCSTPTTASSNCSQDTGKVHQLISHVSAVSIFSQTVIQKQAARCLLIATTMSVLRLQPSMTLTDAILIRSDKAASVLQTNALDFIEIISFIGELKF